MATYDIIEKKRNGKELSCDEINFMVAGLLNETVTRAQFTSLLMAIMLNGMNTRETYYLTKAMLKYGDVYHFHTRVCDKHSTGGVSDSTTLLIVPILAALNIKIAKMSGRALGFTGGTADKLEVFPNYNLSISEKQVKQQLDQINCAIITQSKNIAIADKVIYTLRDETACVDSIPLIASSILSKKLASGADYLLFNVQYGTGAFMKTKKDALTLAKLMVKIARIEGKDAQALISNMDTPLSGGIGCGEEVRAVLEAYSGKNSRLRQLSVVLATTMVEHELKVNKRKAKKMVLETLSNGKALSKFSELIESQGGNNVYTNDYNLIPKANIVLKVKAKQSGYISKIDALLSSKALMHLKEKNKSEPDLKFVGIKFFKNIGDKVTEGEVIAEGYSYKKSLEFETNLLDAVEISKFKKRAPKLVYKLIK